MANDRHYPEGTPGGKGGQFAPKGADATVNGTNETGNGSGSISYIPQTTSRGEPRRFYVDLSVEEQEKMERDYVEKHKDILAVNDELYDKYKTSRINTPERQFERAVWINEEFEEQLAKGPKRQEKRATLLLGLPGSGKSSIATPLSQEMGAFIVDADEFKKRIPEFQKDHRMVSAVHHESVNLADQFREDLSNEGYNMIIGKVGGDYESIEYILEDLQAKGYMVDIVLNDLPFDIAVDRTIGRFDRGETDRLIPFWTLKTADKNVFSVFDKALEHPAVIGGKVYSNDVPKGTAPVLLHEFKK